MTTSLNKNLSDILQDYIASTNKVFSDYLGPNDIYKKVSQGKLDNIVTARSQVGDSAFIIPLLQQLDNVCILTNSQGDVYHDIYIYLAPPEYRIRNKLSNDYDRKIFIDSFEQCFINPKIDIIGIPYGFTVFLYDKKKKEFVLKGGHANMIIINKKRRSIEKYEPHGQNVNWLEDPKTNALLNKAVNQHYIDFITKYNLYIPETFEKFCDRKSGPSSCWEIITSQDFCPVLGIQAYESIGSPLLGDPDGFCVFFSLLWLILRTRFPNQDPQQLAYALDDLIKKDPKAVRKYIRDLSYYLLGQSLYKQNVLASNLSDKNMFNKTREEYLYNLSTEIPGIVNIVHNNRQFFDSQIIYISNCNAETKLSNWKGALLDEYSKGCAINTLTFLDFLTQSEGSTLVSTCPVSGTPSIDISMFLSKKIDENVSYGRYYLTPLKIRSPEIIVKTRKNLLTREEFLLYKRSIERFFIHMAIILPDNSCTIIKAIRALDETGSVINCPSSSDPSGHTFLLSKKDNSLYTVDPQVNKRVLTVSYDTRTNNYFINETTSSKLIQSFINNCYIQINYFYYGGVMPIEESKTFIKLRELRMSQYKKTSIDNKTDKTKKVDEKRKAKRQEEILKKRIEVTRMREIERIQQLQRNRLNRRIMERRRRMYMSPPINTRSRTRADVRRLRRDEDLNIRRGLIPEIEMSMDMGTKKVKISRRKRKSPSRRRKRKSPSRRRKRKSPSRRRRRKSPSRRRRRKSPSRRRKRKN